MIVLVVVGSLGVVVGIIAVVDSVVEVCSVLVVDSVKGLGVVGIELQGTGMIALTINLGLKCPVLV